MNNALQSMLVTAKNTTAQQGLLHAGDLKIQCALGRGGLTEDKREGDGATPLGTWPLRELFYRADKLPAPETGLQTKVITQTDGWCDDPGHSRYNLPVDLPFTPSHENLWRDDHLYDLVVPLGYNDDPPVNGLGSAIFFHLAHRDFRPTQGCVAITLEDMMKILPLCTPQTMMVIEV